MPSASRYLCIGAINPWGWDWPRVLFREVDIPGFDQRIQKGNAVFNGHIESIRVQELENADSHRFIALAAESRHRAEPGFTVQFVFGDSFDYVQKLLCDQAFEFAEGLLLKNHPDLFFFVRCALAENQLSNFLKQGLGWVP